VLGVYPSFAFDLTRQSTADILQMIGIGAP
jgi:hypothetical protein